MILDVIQDINGDGWIIQDDARVPHIFVLPRRTIHAGESLEISNPGKPVWNNNGDAAHVFDAGGREIDTFRYGGGATERAGDGVKVRTKTTASPVIRQRSPEGTMRNVGAKPTQRTLSSGLAAGSPRPHVKDHVGHRLCRTGYA